MTKKAILSLLLIYVSTHTWAQRNLVRNPSFEFDTIAPAIEQLNWHRYQYWMSDRASDAADPAKVITQHWFQPTKGTPDYFNSYRSNHVGFATKNARTGKGRMAIIAGVCHNSLASWLVYQQGYSEYIETRLSAPLVGGKTYCVRYYIALDRKSHFAAARLGAVLTRDSLLYPDDERAIWDNRVQPQIMNDTNRYITADMGWVMICDTFVAAGGEEFLTIGNFDFYRPKHIHKVNKSQRGGIRWTPVDKYAYYYIDDVSVTEVPEEAPPCVLERDSIARNNLFLIIETGNNDSVRTAVRMAIHQLSQNLNPGDLISIGVPFEGDILMCLEHCPADSLTKIVTCLESLPENNEGKTFSLANGIQRHFLKKQLIDGNNQIILITKHATKIRSSDRKSIQDYFYHQNIGFSIIQIGPQHSHKKNKALACENGGTYSKVSLKNIYPALLEQAPLEQQDTKYTGRKNYVVASWVFLSKVMPVLLLVILLRSR